LNSSLDWLGSAVLLDTTIWMFWKLKIFNTFWHIC